MENTSYRIGDAIVKDRLDAKNSRWSLLSELAICFPGSTLAEYFERIRASAERDRTCGVRWDVLADVIKGRYSSGLFHEKPAATDIVLHLRLGDVLECQAGPCGKGGNLGATPEEVARELWRKQHFYYSPGWIMTYPEAWYKNALLRLPPAQNISKTVTIVSSLAHRTTAEAPVSVAYRKMVGEWFESNGYNVNVRGPHSVDEDLAFMASAHTLIKGPGGFGEVAAGTARAMGAVVLR